MVKTLLALLLVTSLYSQDLVTLYRTQGMEDVIRKLDRTLTDIIYWQNELTNKDLRFGYFESIDSLLQCNKERSELVFLKREEEGEFVLEKSFNAYTGKLNGDKRREGDLKTPVGVYRLTKRLNQLDPFYGPLAFVTSYPNFYDRIQGKNGSGIWIHGLPDNAEREPYTRGCIAIENSDIIAMSEKLSLENSVIVIESKEQESVELDTFALLLAELYHWRYAWLYNDLTTYLDFYADDFQRHDGMHKKRFADYKRQVFAYNDKKQIHFKDLNIIPYPSTHESLFLIWFEETYFSKRINFQGEKSLIVRVDNGEMKIVAEK